MGKYIGWFFFCVGLFLTFLVAIPPFEIQNAIYSTLVMIFGLAYVIEYKVSEILDKLK